MNNQERKANLAYGALMTLLALALLCFITRLWPILLLVILGVFVAALRLLFLSAKSAQQSAQPVAVQPPRAAEPEPDLESLVFANVCARVTALVHSKFPEANWIWERSDARARILNGETVGILLNQAGGYRRGEVRLNCYRVEDVVFPQPKPAPVPDTPDQEPDTDDQPAPEPPAPENYELMAFEWVEAHILELNTRCNEAVGNKRSTLLIKPEELPKPESWPAICAELAKQDISNTACRPEGIWIQLDGGAAA